MSNIKHILSKIKEPYVILLVGPVLSGKSVFVKENLKDVTVISRDALVMSLHHNDNYEEAFSSVNQKEVNRLLYKKMEDCSTSKKNVVVDMTNLSRKRRRDTLSYFDDYYKIAIVFPILPFDEYKRRNEKRKKEENKYISPHIITNMINSYQSVKSNENFDKIILL